jgi:hypothetical protein
MPELDPIRIPISIQDDTRAGMRSVSNNIKSGLSDIAQTAPGGKSSYRSAASENRSVVHDYQEASQTGGSTMSAFAQATRGDLSGLHERAMSAAQWIRNRSITTEKTREAERSGTGTGIGGGMIGGQRQFHITSAVIHINSLRGITGIGGGIGTGGGGGATGGLSQGISDIGKGLTSGAGALPILGMAAGAAVGGGLAAMSFFANARRQYLSDRMGFAAAIGGNAGGSFYGMSVPQMGGSVLGAQREMTGSWGGKMDDFSLLGRNAYDEMVYPKMKSKNISGKAIAGAVASKYLDYLVNPIEAIGDIIDPSDVRQDVLRRAAGPRGKGRRVHHDEVLGINRSIGWAMGQGMGAETGGKVFGEIAALGGYGGATDVYRDLGGLISASQKGGYGVRQSGAFVQDVIGLVQSSRTSGQIAEVGATGSVMAGIFRGGRTGMTTGRAQALTQQVGADLGGGMQKGGMLNKVLMMEIMSKNPGMDMWEAMTRAEDGIRSGNLSVLKDSAMVNDPSFKYLLQPTYGTRGTNAVLSMIKNYSGEESGDWMTKKGWEGRSGMSKSGRAIMNEQSAVVNMDTRIGQTEMAARSLQAQELIAKKMGHLVTRVDKGIAVYFGKAKVK